jgi:hypothetical protein
MARYCGIGTTTLFSRSSMTFRYLPRLAGCLCIGLITVNSQAQSESHQDFICSSGSMKRIVSIITFGPSDKQPRGACRVDYTKDGATRTVWSSGTGHAYCAKQATVLVTKLAEAHYLCRPETAEQPDEAEAPR